MPVGGIGASLKAVALEIADGDENGNGEKGKGDEERRGFAVFFIQNFGKGDDEECEKAKDGFLASLGEKAEDEGAENPVADGVFIESPAKNPQGESRKENVERLDGHRPELKKNGRLRK